MMTLVVLYLKLQFYSTQPGNPEEMVVRKGHMFEHIASQFRL